MRGPMVIGALIATHLAVTGGVGAPPPTPRPGWTPTGTLASAGAAHTAVDIATSRRGDAAIAWITEDNCCQGNGSANIRYRVRAGGRFAPVKRLEAEGVTKITAAISPAGEPLVAWVANGSVRAAARRRGQPWRTWTVAAKVSDVVAVRAAIGQTGRMTVVWVQQDGAGPATIHGASLTVGDAEDLWQTDTPVTAPNGPVSIGVSLVGVAHAVWPRPDGSIDTVSRTADGVWSGITNLAPAGSAVPAATVRLDVAPLGQAVTAWFADEAATIRGSILSGTPPDAAWEAPVTITTQAPGLFSNLAVSIDNGAAISWAGACSEGLQRVGVAHRTGTSTAWFVITSPPVLKCDLADNVISSLGVLRGPRLAVLAPAELGDGPHTAFGAQGAMKGRWQRGALPGDQSVAAFDGAGRVGVYAWTRPEDGTALQWRQYLAP